MMFIVPTYIVVIQPQAAHVKDKTQHFQVAEPDLESFLRILVRNNYTFSVNKEENKLDAALGQLPPDLGLGGLR